MAFTSSRTMGQRLVLSLLLLLLLGPALQAVWPLVPVRPLGGASESAPAPQFNWATLLGGSFQSATETSLTERLGFLPWLIRLRNQLEFSLFDQIHAIDVVLGQRQVLYQGGPTEAYLGRDYLGPDQIKLHSQRVRDVQDSLARHGVQLLYVLAPGKPGFQPEDLPEWVQTSATNPTNYGSFAKTLPEAGVHVLDASYLFRLWKSTAAHPLFPRGGTHWSGYSITLVADTLFRAVEQLTHRDLPDFTTQSGLITSDTDSLRSTDNDIASGLSLIWPPTPYRMAYPVVVFRPASAKQYRPNTLLVGDSFTQSLYGFYPYLPKLLDERSRFWYYNQTRYWPEHTTDATGAVHELNLRHELEGRDIIILLATEQNLSKQSFGFIDEVYKLYHPS